MRDIEQGGGELEAAKKRQETKRAKLAERTKNRDRCRQIALEARRVGCAGAQNPVIKLDEATEACSVTVLEGPAPWLSLCTAPMGWGACPASWNDAATPPPYPSWCWR